MKLPFLALALIAACGDNLDQPQFDAGPDADANETPPTRAVIVAGDFQAIGVLSVLDVETRTARSNVAPATAVGADPVLRKIGDELYVVNRTDNNVTILDAADFSLVEQIGTGAMSNPQDVAAAGQKLWIPAYGGKGIVEVTRGSATVTEIDLSADDPDGKPNCASIYKVGNKLYVACQLLDDTQQFLPPRGNGKVYVVDTVSRAITSTIDLSTVNPFSLLEQLPDGDLVIGTVDFRFGMNNAGCIQRITTGATPSASCMIDNSMFDGGFAGRLDVTSGQLDIPKELLVLVPRADFSGGDIRVITIDPVALQPAAFSIAGQALSDIAACPDLKVVAAENPPFGAPDDAPQGLRVYTAPATEATSSAVPIGLKPSSSHGLVCY